MPTTISYPQWMTPGTTRNYTPAYGGVPNVPDPRFSGDEAQQFNWGSLGDLFGMGKSIDQFNESELLSNLGAALPGYADMTEQSSRNIGSKLRGEVPADVLARINESAAERGVSRGVVGSRNSSAATLRALGLTSLDLENQGEADLTGAIKRTPLAQPYDITKNFLTPADMQEANLYSSIYASAPNPAEAAKAAQDAVLKRISAGIRPPADYSPTFYNGQPGLQLDSHGGGNPGSLYDDATGRRVGDAPSFYNPRGGGGGGNNYDIAPGSLSNATSEDYYYGDNGEIYDNMGNLLADLSFDDGVSNDPNDLSNIVDAQPDDGSEWDNEDWSFLDDPSVVDPYSYSGF